MWRNYSSKLFKVYGVNEVRHIKIHTAEPLEPEPSTYETEIAIKKLRSHKSPDIDHIPAELVKKEG
jgi:hypothetical protein